MAALGHISDFEELTRLRTRVLDLERQLAERTKSSLALEESHDLFEAFSSRQSAFAWMKDELGRYIYANSEFQEFIAALGRTCLGNSDPDIWPEPLANRLRAADQRALSAHGTRDFEEFFPTPSGERHYRICLFPFRTKSGKLYAAGTASPAGAPESDHKTDARSRGLFQCELIGVMECAGDLVVNANDALLGWLGFTRDDLAAHAVNWRNLTPSRYRAEDDNALAELRSKGSSPPYEKELLDRHGKTVPVLTCLAELNVSPVSGETSFTFFVVHIGDRKQLEARLLRSQKLESLGLIAGGVAHDFNNLLATIMGNASLSLDAVSREHPAFRPLTEVVIASRRASDLTQQVLAYSGRAKFSLRQVDLSVAVREIGSLLETTISKKIDLKFELTTDLPFIEADEGQLQQVIMNLVINASDAIGEQPGEIVVTTREIEGDQTRSVCFEVRDTGCGMSEATRARIFDPFFTTKTNGRGLGLAAVMGIVRNHNGELLVESEAGVGTAFRVILPASHAKKIQTCPAHVRKDLWGTETILVADDDEGIRRMTRTALERLGYRVLLAADGDEAVRVFGEHRGEIAVVLLDWAMPVMNGDEALRRIVAIDPSARILMSSGYAETETLKRLTAGDSGTPVLAGFVQKPYTTACLAGRLREIIANRPGAISYSQSSAESRAGA